MSTEARKRARRRLFRAVGVALPFLFGACSEKLPTTSLAECLGPPDPVELRLGPVPVHLEAYPIVEDLVTDRPIVVGDRSRLEFCAVGRGGAPGARCELYGNTGDGEVLLGDWPVVELSGPVAPGDPRPETPAVELASYRGEKLWLRWHLTTDFAEGAAILKPTLHGEMSTPRPDILFICSDTHRYDHACGPDAEALMPELRRFAADAVTYTHATAPASWTLPSIASTLTGLFPRNHRTGLRNPELAAKVADGEEPPPATSAPISARDRCCSARTPTSCRHSPTACARRDTRRSWSPPIPST